MSLRRRKRRQNRIAKMQVPATRTARTVLAPVRSRGLRNMLQSFESRHEIRTTRTEMAAPAVRRRLVSQRAARRANNAVLSDRNNFGLISGPVLGKIVVDLPRHHPVCVARRERRQVIFAKRKAGKSGQKPRKPSVIIRCE